MSKDLTARRQQAEATFNELVKQKEEYQQKINEIDVELVKLQGEARVLDELLGKSGVSPEPNVIDVDKALKGKKK